MERKVRKIFQRELHKFVLSYNGFCIRKENENCWSVFKDNPIHSCYFENDEKKILLFCDRFASRFGNAGEKSINVLTFLLNNPTVEEKENSMMHGNGKSHITTNKEEKMNPAIARVDIFFKICDLFSYRVIFDDVKAEFTIETPSSTLTFKNTYQEVIQFCADLNNVPGCKDKSKYTHLVNDLYELEQEQITPLLKLKEEKKEGTKITLLIIKQERNKLAESIADTTKTLLLMEDKTSWLYKQNEKLLVYFNAMFKVADEQYNLNK